MALGLLLLCLAGCDRDAAPSAAPVVFDANEFRREITEIDRLVFAEGSVDAARREALAAGLEATAARAKVSSDSWLVAAEAFELRWLAARARELPPSAVPERFASQWMRIRSNLFEDQSWFARSAADLEWQEAPAPRAPAAARALQPSAPVQPSAAEAPAEVRSLMAELEARGPAYPLLERVVAIGEQLVVHGAAARAAAAPLANWLRFYSFGADPARQELLRRLGAAVSQLDPEASYYGDWKFQYGPDKSEQDRSRTVSFLLYGPLTRERAVPVFSAALADPAEWIRDLAAAGLAQYGEPVPADARPFAERVLSTSPRANEGAIAEFRSLDQPARSARVRSLLASGNPRDASAVGRLYQELRDPWIPAALLEALSDPAALRGSLSVLLDYRIAVPEERVPALLAGMRDERPEVRDAARRTLLLCGPPRRALVPMLIAALASGPAALAEPAATALEEITGRNHGSDFATWRRWHEAKLEGEPPTLLLPGPHHGDEVPLNADGAWWAICGPPGARRLKQVTVSVRIAADPAVDAASQETGAEAVARDCDEPLAFLRNVPGLRERALTEGTVAPIQNGASALRYGKTELALRRLRDGESGFRIELLAEGKKQTLFSAETGFSEGAEPWRVSWLGDLDGDGRADLMLEASEHENVGQTFLFLSGAAKPDALLERVAAYRTVGC